MIITKTPIEITRSETFEEISFGVREEDMAIVFETLRDLYSDSPLALIREYGANAWDSHLESNKEHVPIEVTLPNRLHPVLEIKDEGLGLSQDDIRNIFVFYAASGDKRNRSDTIGGFGIGAKSAFSYGDTFSVESIYEKQKTIYSAYIDETGIGKMAILVTEFIDKPNGVTIKIPVKSSDIDLFKRAAEKIFEFWPVKPNFKGLDIQFPERKYLLEGDDWGIYSFNAHRHIAVVNHIPYNIDLDFLGFYGPFEAFKSLGMVFHFKYEDVEVSKNRENIKLTDKAKNSIKARLEAIRDQVSKDVVDKISNASSYIEAVKIYNNLFQTELHHRNFKSIIGDLIWNDKKVTSSIDFSKEVHICNSKLFLVTWNEENNRILINKKTSSDGYRRSKRCEYTPKDDNILVLTKDSAKDVYLRGVAKLFPDKKIYLFQYNGNDNKYYQSLVDSLKPYILEDFEYIRYKGNGGRKRGVAQINRTDYRVRCRGSWESDVFNKQITDFEDENFTFVRFDLLRNKIDGEGRMNFRFRHHHIDLLNIIECYIKENNLQNEVKIIGLNRSVRHKFKKVNMVNAKEYYYQILREIKNNRKKYIYTLAQKTFKSRLPVDFSRILAYDGFKTRRAQRALRLGKFLNNKPVYYLDNLDNLILKIYSGAIKKALKRFRGLEDEVISWINNHPVISMNYANLKDKFLYIDLMEKSLDKYNNN